MTLKKGAIVLAAGDGKRMRSDKSKVCCEVLFKPMINWVLDALKASGIEEEDICVVVSDKENGVRELLPENVKTAVQAEKLGTAHAVLMAKDFLKKEEEKGISHVGVFCGDAPFIDKADLEGSFNKLSETDFDCAVLTSILPDGESYGRIKRQGDKVLSIVEKKNCTEEELDIKEVNSGAYWFKTGFLLKNIEKVEKNPVSGEYYLTDMCEIANRCGNGCLGFACHDPSSVLGANTRAQLSLLNEIAREKVFSENYQNGVSIPIKDGIIISPDAKIGENTEILPNTIIKGAVIIGKGNSIGPNSCIDNSIIGDNNIIEQTKMTDSSVGNECKIGPFTQLRPNSHIGDRVKIGNFVEVKNSTVGEKTSFAHLTYIGDSDFGSHINVGCGVVTVNYDGVKKYRTTVEDNAFIGCNSNLIAPVTVKKGAYVAAASTVTDDIEEDALAIGRVRLTVKPKGALKHRKK